MQNKTRLHCTGQNECARSGELFSELHMIVGVNKIETLLFPTLLRHAILQILLRLIIKKCKF